MAGLSGLMMNKKKSVQEVAERFHDYHCTVKSEKSKSKLLCGRISRIIASTHQSFSHTYYYTFSSFPPLHTMTSTMTRQTIEYGTSLRLHSILLMALMTATVVIPSYFNVIAVVAAFALTPKTPPQDVLQQQLTALQDDDITAVYQLASPNNKQNVGTLQRFEEMVRGGPYRHLVGHAKSQILLESDMVQSKQYLVRVVPKNYQQGDTKNGQIYDYWWSLSRCRGGPYDGSYMVDAVFPDL